MGEETNSPRFTSEDARSISDEFAAACFIDNFIPFADIPKDMIRDILTRHADSIRDGVDNLQTAGGNLQGDLAGIDPHVFTDLLQSDKYADLREHMEHFSSNFEGFLDALADNDALERYLQENPDAINIMGAGADPEKFLEAAKMLMCDSASRDAFLRLMVPHENMSESVKLWDQFIEEAKQQTIEKQQGNQPDSAPDNGNDQDQSPESNNGNGIIARTDGAAP